MWTLFKTFALVAALATASQARPAHVPRAQVFTSCSVPNTVAITFDDGPYQWTRTIVDTLDAAGAKGTFFVNGNNFGCIYSGSNPSNLRYAYAQGHQIASHTWSHPHLPSLSTSQIRTECTKINGAIQDIIGVIPAFIRPPYGEYNQNVEDVADELGQTIVTWDFDSGDADGVSAAQSETAYQELAQSQPNNVLTLNHETHVSTVNDVLPSILQAFAGYNFVTVAECLGMDPYLSTGAASGPSGTC